MLRPPLRSPREGAGEGGGCIALVSRWRRDRVAFVWRISRRLRIDGFVAADKTAPRTLNETDRSTLLVCDLRQRRVVLSCSPRRGARKDRIGSSL